VQLQVSPREFVRDEKRLVLLKRTLPLWLALIELMQVRLSGKWQTRRSALFAPSQMCWNAKSQTSSDNLVQSVAALVRWLMINWLLRPLCNFATRDMNGVSSAFYDIESQTFFEIITTRISYEIAT
jgi:hypothetical protein